MASLVAEIQKAISSDNTYLFDELLERSKALISTPHHHYYTLLELFSYGQYRSYCNSSTLPKLTGKELTKLRILALVRMGISSRVLKYADILAETGLTDHRALEDLVIHCIQNGLLDCRVDEARHEVHVNQVSGYLTNDYDYLLNSLQQWSASCSVVLANIQGDVDRAGEQLKANIHQNSEHQKGIEAAKAAIKKEKPQREASATKSRKRLP